MNEPKNPEDEQPGQEPAGDSPVISQIAEQLKPWLSEELAKIRNEMAETSKAAVQDAEARLGQQVTTIGKSIFEQMEAQLETKMKSRDGNDNPAGNSEQPGAVNNLLANATIADVVEVIKVFKQPSDQQSLMGMMGFGMRWYQLGAKMSKGNATGDDLEKAIADTFGQVPPG